MNTPDDVHPDSPSDPGRREFLTRVAGESGAVLGLGSRPATPSRRPAAVPNLIRDENREAGQLDWQLTRVRADQDDLRSPWIEGFCSKQSVKAGETIDLMVSTDPPRRSQIEIFRTGYYGGRGARLMRTLGPFEGKAQPMPTPGRKNLHECQWDRPRLTIPADWPSGVYLAG